MLTCFPLIESDTPLPHSVPFPGRFVPPVETHGSGRRLFVAGPNSTHSLRFQASASCHVFRFFNLPDGSMQPLLDVIQDAISRAQSGRDVAPSLDPLLAFSDAVLHPPGRNRHGPLRNWYLLHGNPPSSTARILPESAFNAADLTHYHGARSGPKKARFELWTASPLNSFESFLNTNRTVTAYDLVPVRTYPTIPKESSVGIHRLQGHCGMKTIVIRYGFHVVPQD